MKIPIEIKHLIKLIEESIKNYTIFRDTNNIPITEKSYYKGQIDALNDVLRQLNTVYADSKT